MIWLAQAILFGSYLVFPFLAGLFFVWRRGKRKTALALAVLSLLFVWARFIEPQIIITRETKIDAGFEAKIVLIGDLHLGAYKNRAFLERVAQKINEIDPDYVLIAGDFIYFPAKNADLQELFAPLKTIKKPIFAVWGNHDREAHNLRTIYPGLKEALEANRVLLLQNKPLNLKNFTLLALGDYWEDEDEVALLNNYRPSDNLIVLTHNPDTVNDFPNQNADLTLTGHTHGGQIRLPLVYRWAIPTNGSFDRGLTAEKTTPLYITSGLGEIGLPMRLFAPPVIELLSLR